VRILFGLPVLFLALWQIGFAEGRLVVVAYPMPIYYGYAPGYIEYEADVGRPEREKLGLNYPRGEEPPADSLQHRICTGSDVKKGEEFVPTKDEQGHVWTRSNSRPVDNKCISYILWRDSIAIYHFYDCTQTEYPESYLRRLHWWVETFNYQSPEDSNLTIAELSQRGKMRGFQVIVDGELLSDKFGYSETWDLHYVGGKEFFSFRKDSTFGWNYDGHETLTDFNEFFHDGCCESGTSNPRFYADSFNFYAKRGSTWYLVVGEIKDGM
jgi:hypothetical protein